MIGRMASGLLVGLLLISPARAHVGPPYAIFVDREVGPCLLSVWADPDVGTGTFFLMPEPLPGQKLPDDLSFDIWVQPADRREAEVRYPAARQEMRRQIQFYAETEFPTEELWRVRIVVRAGGNEAQTETEVQVTPPGLGAWDLALYLFPFIPIGILWILMALRPRRAPAG